jgi:hypothetical protein
LGEGGLKILTKLINTIYETEEWLKDFTEIKINALSKKTRATECSAPLTISLIAHTEKIIAKILRRRIGPDPPAPRTMYLLPAYRRMTPPPSMQVTTTCVTDLGQRTPALPNDTTHRRYLTRHSDTMY